MSVGTSLRISELRHPLGSLVLDSDGSDGLRAEYAVSPGTALDADPAVGVWAGYHTAMSASGQRQMGDVCSSGVSTGCVCTSWQMSSAVKTWRCSNDSHFLVSFHIFSCLTFLVGWGCTSWISLFWPMYFWKPFSMFLAKCILKNVAGPGSYLQSCFPGRIATFPGTSSYSSP